MNKNIGYIYLRTHESYNIDNVYKMDITDNLYKKENEIKRMELIKGEMIYVLEVSKHILEVSKRLLELEFKDINVRYDGGVNFYKREIIDLIEKGLDKNKIKYRKLDKMEIKELLEKNDEDKKIKKKFFEYLRNINL